MRAVVSCLWPGVRARKRDMGAEPLGDAVRLIQQIAQGDRGAFGSFYDRFAPLVFTFATRLLRARSEAEDLLQEVFLQVWRQAGSYTRDRGSPEAWLITITRSRGIDKLRSIRRRDKGFVSIDEPGGAEAGRELKREEVETEARLMVEGPLARLPQTQQRVLEMAYFDGFTQAEIAARLGEPLGTVKTRMRDGLERLRGLLGAKAAEGPG